METIWFQLAGLCFDCHTKGVARNHRLTEVIHAGRRSNLPIRPKAAKSRNRGKGANHGARKAAKQAALRRLADTYPEMYAMVYAEERLKRGLAPVPLRSYQPLEALGQATADFDPVYAALLEAGEQPDGLS